MKRFKSLNNESPAWVCNALKGRGGPSQGGGPSRLPLSQSPAPGPTQQAPTPEIEKYSDVNALKRARSWQTIQTWQDQSGRDVAISDVATVGSVFEACEMFGAEVDTVMNGINNRTQDLMSDRDRLNSAIAGIKASQRRIQNVSQALSIIESVLANRFNYIRRNNLDGKGRRTPSDEGKEFTNKDGKRFIVRNGVLEELPDLGSSKEESKKD